MDDKGFIFTFDSALALIPIFILIIAVSNVDDGLSSSSKHLHSLQSAQDTLIIMSNYPNGLNSNPFQEIANVLAANNDSDQGVYEAGKIANYYLKKTILDSKYCLMETKRINRIIASNGDIKNADDASVGLKSYEGYLFKLYIWN